MFLASHHRLLTSLNTFKLKEILCNNDSLFFFRLIVSSAPEEGFKGKMHVTCKYPFICLCTYQNHLPLEERMDVLYLCTCNKYWHFVLQEPVCLAISKKDIIKKWTLQCGTAEHQWRGNWTQSQLRFIWKLETKLVVEFLK